MPAYCPRPTTNRASCMPANHIALAISRGAIGFVWLYQGLIPKLLGPHADELAMDMALGVSENGAHLIAYTAGGCEIAIGLCVLMLRRQEWPLWLTLIMMAGFLVFAAWSVPSLLIAAFNPVIINVAMAALAAIALLLQREIRPAS